MFKKLLCCFFGHDWIFPMHLLRRNSKPIETSDYKCKRCKERRTN
jgi:hypothetical protein